MSRPTTEMETGGNVSELSGLKLGEFRGIKESPHDPEGEMSIYSMVSAKFLSKQQMLTSQL